MTRLALGGLLLMTIACAPVPPAEPAEEPIREFPGSGQACNAAGAKALIGRQRSSARGAEALRLTGARSIRWIPPGAAVTMDYREDRLNIELDSNNRITAIRCG